jgi:hypothetical protein
MVRRVLVLHGNRRDHSRGGGGLIHILESFSTTPQLCLCFKQAASSVTASLLGGQRTVTVDYPPDEGRTAIPFPLTATGNLITSTTTLITL